MGITLDGVVSVGDHAGKGITDIATLDDSRGLLHVPCQENKRQNNTRSENPFVNLECNGEIL